MPEHNSTLGNSYATGAGVLTDVAEAVKWYRKAAGQGLTQAQLNWAIDAPTRDRLSNRRAP